MPDDYPAYPNHEQMLAYIRSYARAFGLYETARFNAPVTRLAREGKGWRLTAGDGLSGVYELVVIATGLQRVPLYPDPAYPGLVRGRDAAHALLQVAGPDPRPPRPRHRRRQLGLRRRGRGRASRQQGLAQHAARLSLPAEVHQRKADAAVDDGAWRQVRHQGRDAGLHRGSLPHGGLRRRRLRPAEARLSARRRPSGDELADSLSHRPRRHHAQGRRRALRRTHGALPRRLVRRDRHS